MLIRLWKYGRIGRSNATTATTIVYTPKEKEQKVEYPVVIIKDMPAVMQRLRALYNRYFEELIAKLFEMNGYEIIRAPIYDGLKPKEDG